MLIIVKAGSTTSGYPPSVPGENAYLCSPPVLPNPLPDPFSGCVVRFTNWAWQRVIPGLVFETRKLHYRLFRGPFSCNLTFDQLVVAVLMLLKFVEHARAGEFSRLSFVLYRDGTSIIPTQHCILLTTKRYRTGFLEFTGEPLCGRVSQFVVTFVFRSNDR